MTTKKIASVDEDVEKLEPAYRRCRWGAATVENSMVGPQKGKHGITIQFSNSASGYAPKITESRDLNRFLCTHIHCSIIHNSQNMETT